MSFGFFSLNMIVVTNSWLLVLYNKAFVNEGLILWLITMIFRLFKISQFFHLGHSRPSIFLSFYGSQWVWLVLEFFLEWYGLIKNDMFLVLWKMPQKKLWKKAFFCWFWTCKRGGCHHGNPENTRNVSMCLGLAHNIFHIILEIKIQ